MKGKSSLRLILGVSYLLFGVSLCYAVPPLMNYQGVLRGSVGSSTGEIIFGTRSMTFAIYDAETEGNKLWEETQLVNTTDGRFNVLLGSSNPISPSLFNEDNRF